MLVIRLTRIGKTNEPAYRIVVAEKARAVKGSFLELIGFYNPSERKNVEFKKDRVEFWIGHGARPSDTVASLFKAKGMTGMEKFIAPRDLKRKKKKAGPEEKAEAPVSVAPVAEAPVSEAPSTVAPATDEVAPQ
ncbi:MAG: 30S ribosomal protein S16 [Candidatus Gracilibacteria bacterium]